MSQPKRIQRSRKAGWRMPPNTIYVGRGTRWGNPRPVPPDHIIYPQIIRGDRVAVDWYRKWLAGEPVRLINPKTMRPALFKVKPPTTDEIQAALRGKNLACWCEPGKQCHADVLLEIANAEPD